MKDGSGLSLELVESEDDGTEFGGGQVTLVVGALEHLVVRDEKHFLTRQPTTGTHVLGPRGQVVRDEVHELDC